MAELIAPISEDLRADKPAWEITKGIEKVNYLDLKNDTPATAFAAGDWVVRTSTGCAAVPSGNGPAALPVLVGNDQYDSQATGQLTVAVGGGFMAKTTKYKAGSYTVGASLCVKSDGLQVAGANDAIVARVMAYDSVKAIMEILVLNR